MAAAAEAASLGAAVTLFEKNRTLGKKLAITGKGRCNLTNDCSPDEVVASVPTNGRFLFGAVHAFPPSAVKERFESLGVPLKTERGARVFPVSDRAGDVVDALIRQLRQLRVDIRHEPVRQLLLTDSRSAILGVRTPSGDFPFDRVIVCTGGLSYPATGSTGDGYRFAEDAGLTVTDLSPSLVPLVCRDAFCAEMMGLSLRNVGLTVTEEGKEKPGYRDFGEMLFAHFGVSGPMILSASAHLKKERISSYVLHVDLKPALGPDVLDSRLVRELTGAGNRQFGTMARSLLPASMIPAVASLAGVPLDLKCNAVTREMRQSVLRTLKDFPVSVAGFRPIEEAIVTSGGVSVKELSPRTMESKKVSGLFFAGEVIDVDGYTGGFNLQIAWSTGIAAARGAVSPTSLPADPSV